jgi:hypothetical protein
MLRMQPHCASLRHPPDTLRSPDSAQLWRVAMLVGMSSAELFRRVDVHGEDLHAISDTVIEIHHDVVQLKDDVEQIKTEHGRLLTEHSVTLGEHGTKLDELSSKLDAVLALLTPDKDN